MACRYPCTTRMSRKAKFSGPTAANDECALVSKSEKWRQACMMRLNHTPRHRGRRKQNVEEWSQEMTANIPWSHMGSCDHAPELRLTSSQVPMISCPWSLAWSAASSTIVFWWTLFSRYRRINRHASRLSVDIKCQWCLSLWGILIEAILSTQSLPETAASWRAVKPSQSFLSTSPLAFKRHSMMPTSPCWFNKTQTNRVSVDWRIALAAKLTRARQTVQAAKTTYILRSSICLSRTMLAARIGVTWSISACEHTLDGVILDPVCRPVARKRRLRTSWISAFDSRSSLSAWVFYITIKVSRLEPYRRVCY